MIEGGCRDSNAAPFISNHPSETQPSVHSDGLVSLEDISIMSHQPPLDKSIYVCAADVTPLHVEWLFKLRIPYGTLTILQGNPKVGKSFLTADIAARVSKGLLMPPNGGPDPDRKSANVLMCNAEDDPARTLRPRLEALGADLNRVFFCGDLPDGESRRPVVLPEDLATLERGIVEKECKLLIIDPLSAFLSGKADAHRDADVRRALFPLKLLAERTQCAVVIVTHLNKMSSERNALYRGGGSIGIVGAARSVLLVGSHPQADGISVLCSIGSNLGPIPPALAFRVNQEDGETKLGWIGEVDVTPEQLLDPPRKREANLKDAAQFLSRVLANGPMPVAEVEKGAEEAGLKKKTLRRAVKEIGIITVKPVCFGGPWKWQLPAEQSPTTPVSPPPEKTEGTEPNRIPDAVAPVSPFFDGPGEKGNDWETLRQSEGDGTPEENDTIEVIA